MAARNEKSMERARAEEPESLIEILTRVHWEIRCLLREMEQILDTSTAIYELYPRIRVALEVHAEGEEKALYEPLSSFPELKRLLSRGMAAHVEIEQSLHRLNQKPWRREQILSTEWKTEFRVLHRKVLVHIDEQENLLFPELSRQLAPSRIEDLGNRYKLGLTGQLGTTQ